LGVKEERELCGPKEQAKCLEGYKGVKILSPEEFLKTSGATS
jgi:hypothetical protein